MIRRQLLSLLCYTALLALARKSSAQNQFFLYGRATWTTGIAAAGIDVQLQSGGQTVATSYVNAAGTYAFYWPPAGYPTDPAAYVIVFRLASDRVHSVPVPHGHAAGTELPAIRLN